MYNGSLLVDMYKGIDSEKVRERARVLVRVKVRVGEREEGSDKANVEQ